MTVLERAGDEVRGERLVCVFRKRSEEILVPQTGGHRAVRVVTKGLPGRAVVDREWTRTTP